MPLHCTRSFDPTKASLAAHAEPAAASRPYDLPPFVLLDAELVARLRFRLTECFVPGVRLAHTGREVQQEVRTVLCHDLDPRRHRQLDVAANLRALDARQIVVRGARRLADFSSQSHAASHATVLRPRGLSLIRLTASLRSKDRAAPSRAPRAC